uniref:Adipogenin n=1 Tax=Terrapene triunguis TaxID=2587831 RepID=A0A674JJF5_9SAUR
MRYPLVPLVNDLTFPLLFFWFCLPFGLLLILLIIWLHLLLSEGKFYYQIDKCFCIKALSISFPFTALR